MQNVQRINQAFKRNDSTTKTKRKKSFQKLLSFPSFLSCLSLPDTHEGAEANGPVRAATRIFLLKKRNVQILWRRQFGELLRHRKHQRLKRSVTRQQSSTSQNLESINQSKQSSIVFKPFAIRFLPTRTQHARSIQLSIL